MFGWFRRILNRSGKSVSLRRWDAAKTDRLNKGHWANVNGATINTDLSLHLETLRTRAAYEASTNPIVEGVINTHANDVVGPHGPHLQVVGPDADRNKQIVALWRAWWRMPDVNGQVPGVAFLRRAIAMQWTHGESLIQILRGEPVEGAQIAMRLLSIHPRRLVTPMKFSGDTRLVLGIEFDANGRPLTYHVSVADPRLPLGGIGSETQPIPAREIIHDFELNEPDQARGVPLLASALQSIADLRDYDVQVLDAARQAADQSVLLHTNHIDAPFIAVNGTDEVERRTIKALPPGWQGTQMSPTQPSTQYVDYRAERQRDIGRPRNMPLMLVRLDASGHNYSSARFDAQLYQRAVQRDQARLARAILDRLLAELIREATLAHILPPGTREPTWQWIWPQLPHVDPLKEAKGEEQEMKNGTMRYSQACARHGLDRDTQIEMRVSDNEALDAADLPRPPQSDTAGDDTELADAAKQAAEEQDEQNSALKRARAASALPQHNGNGNSQ